MNLDTILAAIKLAGSELPAFKALFESIVETFSEQDQETLQKAYAEQMAVSDDLHRQIQDM